MSQVLERLSVGLSVPVVVIQHRANEHVNLLEEVLQHRCGIKVKQADEKEKIRPGIVYVAPPGYHLLFENDHTFSLSSDGPVKHSMPSIDVSLESAAMVFGKALVAIILTGASDDGATGIRTVRKYGGLTIAQDPAEAQFPHMPQSAIDTGCVRFILPLAGISNLLAARRFTSAHEEK